jgi:N-acetylmuramic acid 6-phosphate etherase
MPDAGSRIFESAGMTEQGLMSELDLLVSEGRNPRTMDIDLLPTIDVLRKINDEDRLVPAAVEKVLPEIAAAVDRIVLAFQKGARLIYIGAGTSGRLGVLDASECPPTFGVPEGMVIGLIAGGPDALVRSTEGAEDDPKMGAKVLQEIGLVRNDVVVGIAVSGRTPYVIGGLNYAKQVGATTVALSCNPASTIAGIADIAISPVVGPEVLTGSTRLKSGTAQKLVLNMLTTASMIRIGKSFQNLMVDLNPSNKKLVARATRIVMQTTGCTAQQAKQALAQTGNDVKLAILVTITGLEVEAARTALGKAGGFLRKAISDVTA